MYGSILRANVILVFCAGADHRDFTIFVQQNVYFSSAMKARMMDALDLQKGFFLTFTVPVGVEPTIFRLGGERVIHFATGASQYEIKGAQFLEYNHAWFGRRFHMCSLQKALNHNLCILSSSYQQKQRFVLDLQYLNIS